MTGRTNLIPSNANPDNWHLELEKRGIYRRYWRCSLEELERKGIPIQVQNQYAQVKKYIADMQENWNLGIGMILKGPVGTMKTSMAVAALIEHLKAGHSGLFVPMVSMLDNIFTMKARNKEEWLAYEDRIRNTGLLVLDDLGAEYHQEWVLSKVDAIISERYNRMKPIIITTNLSGDELKGKYAERVYDRLKNTSKVINFSGRSLRDSA
ncbi:MAG: ATP-binding protein [Sporomusa sp.]